MIVLRADKVVCWHIRLQKKRELYIDVMLIQKKPCLGKNKTHSYALYNLCYII